MDLLAPAGAVYQAGTLSGNPIAVRAGLETLKILATPGTYERLEASGARLEQGLAQALAASAARGCIKRVGSLLTLFHGVADVRNAAEARQADTGAFTHFFHAMLDGGIYLPPSQFEAMFVSLAHREEVIDATNAVAGDALKAVVAGS